MAGDGWVVDILFHTLILLGKSAPGIWSSWSSEILLAASFVMQLVLTILAGFRWRGLSGGREQWDPLIRRAIWFSFVAGEYVATTAVGSLSVSSTSGERQLLAFWAPFFLLHLGGPDNITALQLEDNELSARAVLGLVLRVLGATYVVYNSISGRWTLALAAWLMLVVGFAKYSEKILALHRANLETIRSSVRKERRQRRRRRQRDTARGMLGRDWRRSDERSMILFAHSQFHICKRAIVESVTTTFGDDAHADADANAEESKGFFKFDMVGSYEVVEAELSLMYDFLYTKAAVIHTWHGYTIRVLSPLAVLGAILLLELGRKDGLRQADLVITRLLLVATFLLETASLVKALGSSWTRFLLYSRPNWGWLQHHVFCIDRQGSRRQWFPRAIAHLVRLVKLKGHRTWSGRMGQLDLLEELTTHRQPPGGTGSSSRWFIISNDHVFDDDEKELVRVRVAYRLDKSLTGKESKGARLLQNKAASNIRRGQNTLRDAFDYNEQDKEKKVYDKFRISLGTELHVGILIWHIATGIYLCKSRVAKIEEHKDMTPEQIAKLQKRVKAIRTLSNYMMFHLVERPYMLPGLVLRSLYERTSEELAAIWSDRHGMESSSHSMWWGRIMSWSSESHSHTTTATQLHHDDNPQVKNLANFLYEEYEYNLQDEEDNSKQTPTALPWAVQLAKDLIEEEGKRKMEPMDAGRWYDRRWGIVHVILDVWVEMLIYASYRCSGESHAKQLVNGGELTTVVWLAAAHLDLPSKTTENEADNV